MTKALLDKIELHKVVEFYTTSGFKVFGEVVSKDENWIAVHDSECQEPLNIAVKCIYAFRVRRH